MSIQLTGGGGMDKNTIHEEGNHTNFKSNPTPNKFELSRPGTRAKKRKERCPRKNPRRRRRKFRRRCGLHFFWYLFLVFLVTYQSSSIAVPAAVVSVNNSSSKRKKKQACGVTHVARSSKYICHQEIPKCVFFLFILILRPPRPPKQDTSP